jgi:GT2 family glycosyltransferase
MDVAVLVISYNTRDLLAGCLASVQAQLSGRSREIVVVDNASSDGSAEMVATRFPAVKLIRNAQNLGFAAAVNQGIRASAAPYVLLLNSDATLDDGALALMARHLQTHDRAAAVGGTLLHADGTFQGSYADFPTLLGEVLLMSGLSRWLLPKTYPSYGEAESQRQRDVDWVCGAFVLIRRQALDEVGLLDEAYFMYSEEVDWCYRARQRGWTIAFLPNARAVHLVGGSYRRDATRRREQIYRSKSHYFRKNYGSLQGALFCCLVRVISALKLATWAVTSLCSTDASREHARENVASYRYLLSRI